MSSFAFDTTDDNDTPARSRSRRPAGSSWLKVFSAVLAANVLAGVILLVGVRLYIRWSIEDTFNRMEKNPPAQKVK